MIRGGLLVLVLVQKYVGTWAWLFFGFFGFFDMILQQLLLHRILSKKKVKQSLDISGWFI